MALQDVQDQTVRLARLVKEAACRRGPADIPSQILVYRGNSPIAIVGVKQDDRDMLLYIFAVVAVGYDADALGLAFDSYAAVDAATNPLTGKEYEYGEMNDIALNHDGIEKGWISEALNIISVNRAADITASVLLYRYSGKHLVWTEDKQLTPGMEMAGEFPDVMIKAMNAPDFATLMPYTHTEGTRAERDVWATDGLQRVFKRTTTVTLLAGLNEHERIRVLRNAKQAR